MNKIWWKVQIISSFFCLLIISLEVQMGLPLQQSVLTFPYSTQESIYTVPECRKCVYHLLYYILLNMFQTLIRPSSGASEYLLCCVGWLEACWCYVAGLSVGDVISECRLNHYTTALGYHITNRQSRYITPARLKSAYTTKLVLASSWRWTY